MSIKKWEEPAQQKEEVEKQRQIILNAFKARKVKNEMGGLAAEKLFRPITRRIEKIPEDEVIMVPDYDIDDQTRIFKNVLPFGEGDYEIEEEKGVPDYSLLEKDILPEEKEDPEKSLLPDSDDEVFPGEKQRRHSAPILSEPPAYSPPPSYKLMKKDPESVDLSTLEKFLKNNKGDPNAKIMTKKSKFYGWDKNQVEDEVFRIYSERAKKFLKKQFMGQKNMGPFTGKNRKEIRNMLGIEGKKKQKKSNKWHLLLMTRKKT